MLTTCSPVDSIDSVKLVELDSIADAEDFLHKSKCTKHPMKKKMRKKKRKGTLRLVKNKPPKGILIPRSQYKRSETQQPPAQSRNMG